MTPGLSEVLSRQPAPPVLLVVGALVAGALVVAAPRGRAWRRVRILVTIVHEGGHALVGVLFGRRLTAIRLGHDAGGVTETWGRARGVGVTLMTFAGYPFPALVAAALLLAAFAGWSRTAAAAIAVVLLVLLVFARNGRGVVVLGLASAALAAAALWLPDLPLVGVVAALSGVWLTGAGRSLLEERHARRRGAATDVSALARRGAVPPLLWWLVMWVPIGWAGWVVASQILTRVRG